MILTAEQMLKEILTIEHTLSSSEKLLIATIKEVFDKNKIIPSLLVNSVQKVWEKYLMKRIQSV